MNAIKNSRLEPDRSRKTSGRSQVRSLDNRAGKVAWQSSAIHRMALLSAILSILFLSQDYSNPKPAFGLGYEIIPVAQLTINAEGQRLRFPTHVFYDWKADETYVVDGAKRWVIIYASDFYPVASFGAGRDILRPMDGFMDSKGYVYLCQGPLEDHKPGRITIYNGAFIETREITLDNIPNEPEFLPNRVVVNHDGLMYVAGQNNRGVVVLDNDGTFLRWLRPMDETYISLDQIAALEGKKTENDTSAEDAKPSEAAEEQPTKENSEVDIPEQFRPKTKEEKEAESGPHIGPVIIRSVTIDKEGRLYLLSDETSKTYVYSPEEAFLFSFGTKGGTPRTLSNPRGVAIDENRHLIYVVDYMRHAILVYKQSNGEYLFEFGGKGRGPGWFNYPTDIAVNQRGQVIVADLFNHRAQVLDVKYNPNYTISKQKLIEAPSSGKKDDSGKKEEASNESNTSSPEEEEVKVTAPDGESNSSTPDDASVLEKGGKAPLDETNGAPEEEDIKGGGAAAEAPVAGGVPDKSGPGEEKNEDGK